MAVEFDPANGKVTVRETDHIPEAVYDYGEQVEILDISTLPISDLPDEIAGLPNLRIVFASFNSALSVFPDVFAQCAKLETIGLRDCAIESIPEHALPPSLKALILTGNQLTSLPDSIAECRDLQKLMVSGNRLTELPRTLLECQKLEIVRFSVNRLAQSPDWFLELPSLAWYGDASNQFNQPAVGEHPVIDWSAVTLGPEVGRSNNSVVHQAMLADGREVAVKMFGYARATDGLPGDDMAACLRIGDHLNVIGGIAEVINVPNGQKALVLPLYGDDYEQLGKPPSLFSISRDTYDDRTFETSFTLQVAKSVASGMCHLHSVGVMHGDLYAHNIMTNRTGDCVVGDFGSASRYAIGTPAGMLRERVDVRAYGILLEELLARSPVDRLSELLSEVAAECLNPIPHERPPFSDIYQRVCGILGSD